MARSLAGLEVDIVHDHSPAGPLVALGRSRPTVLTAHGPTDGRPGQYFRLLDLPVVAIPEAQPGTAPDLPWAGVVHNAIDVATYPFRADKDDVVLFLGRMAPEKGAHLAAGAARAAGYPVVPAGKAAEAHERRSFDEQVAPTPGPDATRVGEVGGARRTELLAAARCLVCPVQWDEPFGLASIEAMACGTPVVALRRGAMRRSSSTAGPAGSATSRPSRPTASGGPTSWTARPVAPGSPTGSPPARRSSASWRSTAGSWPHRTAAAHTP